MWLLSFLVHTSGTSRLPPGHIFMEHASTSGMPEVVSGSSITVDPLDCIIFRVPSRGPNDAYEIHGCKVCSQYDWSFHVPTDYKGLCEWLVINCKGTGDLAKSTHVFS